ncbi:MBL fold metallo-hydrolase [Actinocrispum sp. NPDC049592]|uniref:MBL fold metallo-hydrolase n=1 Tax=Actinocrispum sp. NPDC049592 TaxID=3154835 RepID=UPI00344ADFAD
MCVDGGDSAGGSAPRELSGPVVDPIALEPVDEVEIVTLVDNVFDALLMGDERTRRPAMGVPGVVAPQFEEGRTLRGLVAEHGFSALVKVRRGETTTTLLFDTGMSPEAMVTNAERMGFALDELNTIVLSHGHFDHAGGLAGLAKRVKLPMVVHPNVWSKRRLVIPGQDPVELPTLSKRALTTEGFDVIERREPSLLLDGSVLITGEVDRTTEFEHGMPPSHQAWDGGKWEHDPLVIDDQALIVNVRNRGLVVLTGCGHAGAVNIVRHAQRLTGVDQLHALIGGLHLSGPAFEPIIKPTVDAFTAMRPSLIVPGHCTGWRAQHTFAAAMPDAWVQSSSGTSYRLAGAAA